MFSIEPTTKKWQKLKQIRAKRSIRMKTTLRKVNRKHTNEQKINHDQFHRFLSINHALYSCDILAAIMDGIGQVR